MIPKAIAGLTGLAFIIGIFVPAKSIALMYDPARIKTSTALSSVNFVYLFEAHRYMKTKKNEPMISTSND